MSANEALSALGLDVTPTAAPVVAAVVEAPVVNVDAVVAHPDRVAVQAVEPTAAPDVNVPAQETTVPRESVQIGEISYGEISLIPTNTRTAVTRTAKYNFSALSEPKKREDGTTAYSNFVVKFIPGTNDKQFRRSVQAAATQANKQAKGKNQPNYYITRAVNDPATGKFVAMMVIRTDDRTTE